MKAMKRTHSASLVSAAALALLAGPTGAWAQVGRALDWPTYANDLQRSGWEKSDSLIKVKDDVQKNFRLLWKMQQKASPGLMSPVLIGTLIGFRGFKELSMTAGFDDSIYAWDTDLNRLYWQTKFDIITLPAKATANCPAGMTAMPTMLPMGSRRPRRPAPGQAAGAPPPPRPNPMYGPRAVYMVSSDGKLRRVNISNGSEVGAAVPIFPANSKVSTLSMSDGILYATTSNGCGGAPNAVWAIDLNLTDPQSAPGVTTLQTNGGNFLGIGGPVVARDGSAVYVQTGDGPSDPATGKYSNALLALDPETLAVQDFFLDSAAKGAGGDLNSVTPVTFDHKGRDFIVAAGRDGRLILLDAKSLKTPLAQTGRIAPTADGGLYGGLTTFVDSSSNRFILATVWGNANGRGGYIQAFQLTEEDGGKLALKPAWTSAKDLVRPMPPVAVGTTAVFALSSGDKGSHAVLHALDPATGASFWSTKNEVTAPGNLTPLMVANGRAYFVTTDSTLWVFGMPVEW